ncbi:MAG: tryptophan--tRNA ligase [Patescibacteria group bacterium]
MEQKSRKPVVVSGMQPSGPLHLGNYLGALKNWIDIQNSGKHDCFFFIADYHSITENYDPKEKKEQAFELICEYLAAGLDPEKSTLFVQSRTPQCAELAWIFNTVTPISELERMTQFKDKSSKQAKNVNMGLFDYPVLQAADILLYHGSLVPVGQDQVQHVELTRDIARWFNQKYKKEYFPLSQPLLMPLAKIMSLHEPEKKMSKSAGEKHWLGIDEEPEMIKKKLSKAVTTPEGIKNLKSIYEAFSDKMGGPFDEKQMAKTKETIAHGLADYFSDFRKKKKEWKKDRSSVEKILEQGRKKTDEIADRTMAEVKQIIGLN